jgi:sugar phosphate isomerase/epimerase
VRVCLDSGHAALGRNWHEFIDIADGRLAHVHASDNRGVFDDHLPPGDGTIDWREIARTLTDANFKGWIMLELHGPPDNPGTLLTRALEQAARVLSPG